MGDVTTDDWANVTLDLQNGSSATVALSRGCATCGALTEVEMYGKKGYLRFTENDYCNIIVHTVGQKQEIRPVPESYGDPRYLNQSASFINLLNGKTDEYASTISNGPQAQIILDAAEIAGINSAAYGRERMRYLKEAAVFCAGLGVKNFLIHAGFIANNPFSDEYREMCSVVSELALFLKRLGLDLLLETGGESPVTLLRLIEDVGSGNVFVNLDTANLIMYGFGNPADAIVTLHPYIRSVHIKDGMPPHTPKELGKETEFGEGFVDFRRVFALLKRYEYNGPYIIEREISDDRREEKIIQTRNSIIGLT